MHKIVPDASATSRAHDNACKTASGVPSPLRPYAPPEKAVFEGLTERWAAVRPCTRCIAYVCENTFSARPGPRVINGLRWRRWWRSKGRCRAVRRGCTSRCRCTQYLSATFRPTHHRSRPAPRDVPYTV
jgi:hypothetical protein